MADPSPHAQHYFDTHMAEYRDKVQTWEQFYAFIEEQRTQYLQCSCMGCAMSLAMTGGAMFKAMQRKPEETDITVLFADMVRILTFEAEGMFGMVLPAPEDTTPEKLQERANQALGNALRSVVTQTIGEQTLAEGVHAVAIPRGSIVINPDPMTDGKPTIN